MKKLLLIIPLMILFLSGCSNQSATNKITQKDNLDLQTKCAEQAQIFFNNKKANIDTWDYQNHYNVTQNKCFILITETFFDKSGISETLYDIFENKEYANGNFGKDGLWKPANYCNFIDQTKDCKSINDFNEFVKNYMEN